LKRNNASVPTSEPVSAGKHFIVAASALFRRNPVLTVGLLVGPLVAAATTLKAAAALSIAVFVIVLPSVVLAKLLQNLLPTWLIAAVSILCSASLSFLAHFLITPISPLIFDAIGIYLPVLIITPVSFVGPGHDHFASRSKRWCILEALFVGIGFSLVAGILGALRELLSSSSLWGIPIAVLPSFRAANTVFAGFILLGFLSAFFRSLAITEKKMAAFFRRRKAEKLARNRVFREQYSQEETASAE